MGDPRFHTLLKELGDLHDQKSVDYDRPSESYSNVRSAQEWGVQPWVGAMVRLTDKVRRLQQFARTGKLLNESAEDSLKDIAIYAMISLILLKEPHE